MAIQIGQFLYQGAARHGERIALRDERLHMVEDDAGKRVAVEHQRAVSYGALEDLTQRMAHRLDEAGYAGHPIALLAENSVDFVAAWFACAYLGSPVVPIPIQSAPREVHFRLEDAGCRALLSDRGRRTLAEQAIGLGSTADLLTLERLPSPAARRRPPRHIDAEHTAMILYTSGTTGRAKGACISHASLVTHTAALVHHTLRLSERDTVMAVLPLTHSYGIRMAILAPFYAGGQSVLQNRFSAEHVRRAVDEHGVTWLPAVPTMFAALCATAPRTHGSLKWCLSAGAPLSDDIRRRAEEALGACIYEGYGLTEATFTSIDTPYENPRAPGSENAARAGVGRPVWGVSVRIGDGEGVDQGGAAAEVWVRGQNVMTGYLNAKRATEDVMIEGWLRTGDVGQVDRDGRLHIVDRLKDLIIRGGQNVYPSEVENALSDAPIVHDLAIVSRPHDYYGEEVIAVVVPMDGFGEAPAGAHDSRDTHEISPSEAAAASWVQSLDEHAGKQVARYKTPAGYAFVERLPTGPSGKVLRRTLREWVTEGTLRIWPAPSCTKSDG